MFTETISVNGVDFVVEFSASPYKPAKISGPPELCYEAEGGEIQIESIYIGDQEVDDVISDSVRDKIISKCQDLAPDLLQDEADNDKADAAEARNQE